MLFDLLYVNGRDFGSVMNCHFLHIYIYIFICTLLKDSILDSNTLFELLYFSLDLTKVSAKLYGKIDPQTAAFLAGTTLRCKFCLVRAALLTTLKTHMQCPVICQRISFEVGSFECFAPEPRRLVDLK